LRDITEVLSRETINVTAVHTVARRKIVQMNFTLEVTGVTQLQRALKLIGDIPSIVSARRI
jgi:GTP pyrophosphokinase